MRDEMDTTTMTDLIHGGYRIEIDEDGDGWRDMGRYESRAAAQAAMADLAEAYPDARMRIVC